MVDFKVLEAAPAQNAAMAWRMNFEPLTIALKGEGMEPSLLHIGPEGVKVAADSAESPNITFVAPKSSWEAFAKPDAPVGFQSLASMLEADNLDIEGANGAGPTAAAMCFARHSFMLETLFGFLRGEKPVTREAWAETEIEPVVGRYLRLNIEGIPYRIYFEEAGEGTPLLCLHTAGSDSRQYRAIMNDPEITKNHRVIAFDLPWHGKSAPPPGFHKAPHMLTTDSYVTTIMTVKDALALDDPIVMGCSIGGRAVLHLALRHGDAFKAGIGLQSATHAGSNMQAKLEMADKAILSRPDMDSSDVGAAAVRQLMSPTSPVEDEMETLYYYQQSAPGVFAGDLFYYHVEGDMRNGIAAAIDTEECPLYLLTGEYDLSATPDMTKALAKEINAQHCEIMEGLGHFPMSEDPEKFKTYLLPVLEKIREAH